LKKFKETGSVADKPQSGRPRVSEDAREVIMANIYASPKKVTRRKTTELGVPKSVENDNLFKAKPHLYKLQLLHRLSQDDIDRRIEMCEWFLSSNAENLDFKAYCFLTKRTSTLMGKSTNRTLTTGLENQHWCSAYKEQGAK
jgi:hypothetical protein